MLIASLSSVYVMLSCTFRYGRQDMDVMGVAFRRDLFLVTRQVYPELQDKDKLTHTRIQQKLLRKLGDNAFPFFFEVHRPPDISSSSSSAPPAGGRKKWACVVGHVDMNSCLCSVSRQPALLCGSAARTLRRGEGTSS